MKSIKYLLGIVLIFFVAVFLVACSSSGGSSTEPTTAPAAPTGVTATAGDGQVTIAWTAVSGATSYNIYWSTTTGVTPANGTKITGATNPYTQTGLTNGTPYYYVVTAVNGNGESTASTQVSATPSGGVDNISMLTPYVNSSDIASINEAFSSTSSCPWGFQHNGVDFTPTGNYKPFQAVASGTVDMVNLWQNNISSNWQVNVRIKVNPTYSVEYVFEPVSLIQADGNTQLANILVSVGQIVAQGDAIGNLFTVNLGAHVHFGLLQNSIAICPETYFIVSAKDSVLGLIHKDNPTWNMCY